MTLPESWCTVPGCERPGDRGRDLCVMHEKRRQRGQDLHAPVVERLPPRERFVEACNSLAEAASDEDFTAAERAAAAAMEEQVREKLRRKIKLGMARAMAEGRKPGPRARVDPAAARDLLRALGSLRAAAAQLKVSKDAVRRALAPLRRGARSRISRQGRGCPPAGGGST